MLWESHYSQASPESPALRLVALQAGFPLSEPRMNIRTIYLAIRVVKNTLSDTRFKVTGQRPGRGWCLGHSAGKQREVLCVAFTPLPLCGQGPPAAGPLMGSLASRPALSRAEDRCPLSCGPAPETLARIEDLEFPNEGAQTPLSQCLDRGEAE